jgi:hypothetical protein
MPENRISQKELKKLFKYDALSGKLVNRVQRGSRAYPGEEAGCLNGNGYRHARINGALHSAHRLIWLYVHGEWPEGEIDHINGIKIDNRIENLRIVSKSGNAKNSKLRPSNNFGIPGIRHKDNRFHARITHERKGIHLGSFKDFFEACCARKSAENRYGFHRNHGRTS